MNHVSISNVTDIKPPSMRSIRAYFLSLLILCAFIETHAQTSDAKAQEIVSKAIEVHGGELFQKMKFSFTFRGKRHTVNQDNGSYVYDRNFVEDGDEIRDVLDNGDFKRYINGDDSGKSERQLSRAFEDVNAVSYFAMLPYKLNDQSVVKQYIGEVVIKSATYDKVKVTFQGEGSGDSPDNVFYYWFNRKTGFMEFLAYNKGGNRFRTAYNQRVIDGVRFADYINFSGGDYSGKDISEYDKLYDEGKLKELSRIILEDVKVEERN